VVKLLEYSVGLAQFGGAGKGHNDMDMLFGEQGAAASSSSSSSSSSSVCLCVSCFLVCAQWAAGNSHLGDHRTN